MKKIIAILLSAVMVLSMAACSATPAESIAASAAQTQAAAETQNTTATPAADTVLQLQWHQSIGIDTLFENPWHDLESLYPYMVYEALVTFDEYKGQYVGKLASDYEISADGLNYTFTLRDGVKWSNGDELTMDDVVFSITGKLADPLSNYNTEILGIVGAEAVKNGEATELEGLKVDGNKLTITLTSPNKNFLYGMALLMILPKKAFDGVAPADYDSADFFKHPYGTGQYAISEVSFPDYFIASAREDYWGPKAGIQKAQFTSYQTGGNDAVVNALISGTLDFAYGNAINDITVANNIVAQNKDVAAKLISSNYTRAMVYNFAGCADGKQHPGMQSKEVRQAIAMLLDRENVAALYNGQAEARTTFVPNTHPMYNSDIPVWERNVEKAKELLNAGNFDFSQPIRICYYYDDQTTIDAMTLLTQNCKEAGVICEPFLATGDLGEVLYGSMNWDLLYFGTTASDPVLMYNAECVGGGEDIELVNEEFRQQTFNTLMEKYLASTNDTDAKKVADELQAVSQDYCCIFPIYGLNTVSVINEAHVSAPQELFAIDHNLIRDFHFEDWKMN
ncbi:MAG: ABC transporter substrate-binding protein [Eubacteriales bacterium]|nr:ABC transporter substrate-binding protein [Eubacteriales bacterium]